MLGVAVISRRLLHRWPGLRKKCAEAASEAGAASSGARGHSPWLVMVLLAGYCRRVGFWLPMRSAHHCGCERRGAPISRWHFCLGIACSGGSGKYAYRISYTKKRFVAGASPASAEIVLALVYGLFFFIRARCWARDVVIGFAGSFGGLGLVQGTLILGGQLLGFVSGNGAGLGRPRKHILVASCFWWYRW